jgi:hypothetical protein
MLCVVCSDCAEEGKDRVQLLVICIKALGACECAWTSSAWRGWPLGRHCDQIWGFKGIQDVQLGGDGSKMAVIDPSYHAAGTRLKGSLFPGSPVAGLVPYVRCCNSLSGTDTSHHSHAFGDFFASQASIDTCWLQQCRGQIGPASVSRSSIREDQIRRSTMSYLSS